VVVAENGTTRADSDQLVLNALYTEAVLT
jgi:hypothetical protein